MPLSCRHDSEEASSSSDDPSPPPPKSWWERLCDTDSWATYCNYIGLAYPVIHSYNYWRRRTLLDELEAYDRETYPTIDTADIADLKKYLFEVAVILGLNESLGLQRVRQIEEIHSISPQIVAEHLHPTLRNACDNIHTALMDRNQDVEELEARLHSYVVEQLTLAQLKVVIVTTKIAKEVIENVIRTKPADEERSVVFSQLEDLIAPSAHEEV
ncbi:hypothetical protein ONZ45_g10014 [Pleurotus djamor]|nr:hypothetical protein ONZ45_g10014 [Pleurotus djamor]